LTVIIDISDSNTTVWKEPKKNYISDFTTVRIYNEVGLMTFQHRASWFSRQRSWLLFWRYL